MTIDGRILAGIMVVLVTAFAWLLIANADLRAAKAIAQSESAALSIDNANFKTRIEQQNAAIAAFETASAARAKQIAKAEDAARKLAEHYTDAAAAFEQQKPDGDGCAAASKLIDRYRESLQ